MAQGDQPTIGDVQAVVPAGVTVERVDRLTGGASRETYRISTTTDGESRPLILQRERGEPRRPDGMAAEAALVRAVCAGGVEAPTIVVSHDEVDESDIGESWLIAEAVEGETIARRILRDDRFARARGALAPQLGTVLARTHRTDITGLDFLEAIDQLDGYRETADELGLASPSFELAFRWLELNRPAPVAPCLVHGDFRLGNLIVNESGLAAVIDWELAHIGDPMEDLGWVCVRAWRFGGAGPVAGVGEYDELIAAYEAESGQVVDRDALRWWELLGTLKWGIMCGTQVGTHRSGEVRSVELAAIGRRIVEQEYDVLTLLGATASEPTDGESREEAPVGPTTAAELVAAVGDFLRTDVMEATTGSVSFHARVASNALAIVGRELASRETLALAEADMLDGFDVIDPAQLATSIRHGDHDGDLVAAAQHVMGDVEARLRVANPRWF